MIIRVISAREFNTMIICLILVIFCSVMRVPIGFTNEDGMKKEDFQISVEGQQLKFTKSPIFFEKDNVWVVPLADFAKQLGLKVEYPDGENIAVLCSSTASELCVPLRFQDSKNGVVHIDRVTYVQPANVVEPFGFQIYEKASNTLEIIHPAHLAPEFTLPDLENVPRHLRDFRGKKTILYVWGSW